MPINVWSVGDADFNMDEQILVRLSEVVNTHPWWTSRLDITLHLIEKYHLDDSKLRIIDAGCGWGLNLLALEKQGFDVTGLDISRQMLQKLDAPGRKLVQADLTKSLSTDPNQFDVATLLDVIEHVDDDRAALKGLAWLLKPGGTMIVSVPALPELTSEFDHIQGHRRRYTEEKLRETFAGVEELEVQEIFWWGEWMRKLIAHQRRVPKGTVGESPERIYERYLQIPKYPLRWGLDLVLAMDRRKTKARRARTGTSLWCVAQEEVKS